MLACLIAFKGFFSYVSFFIIILTDKPSDQALNKVSRSVCKAWQNLGLELHVPGAKIEEISVDNVLYPTVQQKAFQVLKAWKNRGKSVTYDELCRALNEIGLNELAESLRTM